MGSPVFIIASTYNLQYLAVAAVYCYIYDPFSPPWTSSSTTLCFPSPYTNFYPHNLSLSQYFLCSIHILKHTWSGLHFLMPKLIFLSAICQQCFRNLWISITNSAVTRSAFRSKLLAHGFYETALNWLSKAIQSPTSSFLAQTRFDLDTFHLPSVGGPWQWSSSLFISEVIGLFSIIIYFT